MKITLKKTLYVSLHCNISYLIDFLYWHDTRIWGIFISESTELANQKKFWDAKPWAFTWKRKVVWLPKLILEPLGSGSTWIKEGPMKRAFVLMCALILWSSGAYSLENKCIRGSISVDFLWDTTAGLQTYNEAPENIREIPQEENIPYKYFSHSDHQSSMFQTIVQHINEEEIVTFVEL